MSRSILARLTFDQLLRRRRLEGDDRIGQGQSACPPGSSTRLLLMPPVMSRAMTLM